MNKPITVKILVTVNDFSRFDACTLCFETLRVGWPTADIHIYVNGDRYVTAILDKLDYFFQQSKPGRLFWHQEYPVVHHADWIRLQLTESYPGPLVICDPDTVFWKSCEDWEFNERTLLAGYYVPRMWNDFACCVSVPRIHTSLMVFPDANDLRCALQGAYTEAWKKHGEYCPCDPFMGRVMFDEGKPLFWDCCANLYNMLQKVPKSVSHFGEEHKACYDHLNSASFYDVMRDRLETKNREGFIMAHDKWVKNPVPGLWPLVDEYYEQKRIEGWLRLPTEETFRL